MSQFTTQHPLPSCHITKDLIESLENYLLSRLSVICTTDENKDRLKKAISIQVKDSFGTEKFPTIKDYPNPRFADDTSEVKLRIFGLLKPDIPHVSLDIRFCNDKDLAGLDITFEGNNAREFVSGLKEGIFNQIKTNTNNNWAFHPNTFWYGFFYGFFPIITIFPLIDTQTIKSLPPSNTLIFLIIVIGLFTFYFVGGKIKPYISFESKIAESRDWWWKWFVGGFFGFLLFGTLLSFFRDEIIAAYLN